MKTKPEDLTINDSQILCIDYVYYCVNENDGGV